MSEFEEKNYVGIKDVLRVQISYMYFDDYKGLLKWCILLSLYIYIKGGMKLLS